jgi:hypothetical protein
MKKGISRHVVIVSDKVWEDAQVKAIREHKTLALFVEEALMEKLNKRIKIKAVDSKKEKKID